MRLNANLLRSLPAEKATAWLNSLTPKEAIANKYDWDFWARDNQLEPVGDDWFCWLLLAGRGFGKTRSGAEWVLKKKETVSRIALIAPTAGDARDVMVEGESGILACSPPWDLPEYEPSKRRVTWKNGSIATLFSAEEPERLRGPQHGAAWMDELCAWKYQQETYDMALFGLRLGDKPKLCVTTTPKPQDLIRTIVADPTTAISSGSTYENLENLASTFSDTILKKYEGTQLGRQELNAEILESLENALFRQEWFDATRVSQEDYTYDRIVIGVDPTGGGDECGIVVNGTIGDYIFCIEDGTIAGSPEQWAGKTIDLYDKYSADLVVAERNFGGDMVVHTVRREAEIRFLQGRRKSKRIHVRDVHSNKGKVVRAEPFVGSYEKGYIRHVGEKVQLEREMSRFTRDWDRVRDGSPNRLDAHVFSLKELDTPSEAPIAKPRFGMRAGT